MIVNVKSLNSVRVSLLLNRVKDFSLSNTLPFSTTGVEEIIREVEDLFKAYFVLVELLNESILLTSSKDLELLIKDANETREVLRKILLYFFGLGLGWKESHAASLLVEVNSNN